MASRVRNELAASDRLDCLPDWLLLRLHENALDAAFAMYPAMTRAYVGIIDERSHLVDRLKDKDTRHRVLGRGINAHHGLRDTRQEVTDLPDETQFRNARTVSLDAARREAFPLQQSMASARWHNISLRLKEQAHKVLAGDGNNRRVLHGGQGTRQPFEAATTGFERVRATHEESVDSARIAGGLRGRRALMRAL